MLTHQILKDSRYSSYFKGVDAQHEGTITQYVFPEAGIYRFARFCIKYNETITFSSIVIRFSSLAKEQDFYDFTMRVLEPHRNTTLVNVEYDEGGHGSCSAELVVNENGLPLVKSIDDEWQESEIADFEITLDDRYAPAGTYTGTVICELTVKDEI